MYNGVMNTKQVDRAAARYLIDELISVGEIDLAIELHRDDYFDLLVQAGVCQYAPQPRNHPKAAERTEAFFAKYFG